MPETDSPYVFLNPKTGAPYKPVSYTHLSDFDGAAGTLKVCRTLHSQRKGEYTVGETKTNQGMRLSLIHI